MQPCVYSAALMEGQPGAQDRGTERAGRGAWRAAGDSCHMATKAAGQGHAMCCERKTERAIEAG